MQNILNPIKVVPGVNMARFSHVQGLLLQMSFVALLHLQDVRGLVLIVVPVAEEQHVRERRVGGDNLRVSLGSDGGHCGTTLQSL